MKIQRLKQGIDKNLQQTPAFTSKYLDEDKEEGKGEVLTIRINSEERAIIDYIKYTLQYSQDAKALKIGLSITKNVIQNTFGTDLMQKLCSENRRRSILETPKENQNK